MSAVFSHIRECDVRALIEGYPLAWVCSGSEAAQLPLIGEFNNQGRLVALIGHLARANPLQEQLSTTGNAHLLFNGPNAYVSPEHAELADWAPTWNSANLQIHVKVTVDQSLTDRSLDILIAAMEQGRNAPWTREAIAHRYAEMARSIIGFRAEVITLTGRLKFAQDESDAVYRNILRNLPDSAVTDWMRRLNTRN